MADVDSALKDWSATSSNNKPTGATTIGTGLDDNLREIQGAIIRGLSYKGADIASASTTDLGAVEGLMHDITGTTAITSFGTVRNGVWKIIKFEGALTLTHSSNLVIPGGANITTADGDIVIVISEGSGVWRVVSYFKAGSMFSTLSGTETLTNKTLTSPVISGGSINSASVGATVPSTGAFTSLSASGATTLTGVVSTNSASIVAASSGDYVASNGRGYRGANAANTTTYLLLSINASDQTILNNSSNNLYIASAQWSGAQLITVGANDSGGTGYRVLRIPN